MEIFIVYSPEWSYFSFPLSLGPFLEIEEERDHCLGREITSRLVPSLGLVGKIFNDELFKTLSN